MKKKDRDILIASVAGGALVVAGIAASIYFKKRRTIPYGVEAVKNFNIKKYLGKWYEIARLDYRFEKNLDNVTAEYYLNKDGSIKVVNSGYNFKKSEKEESVGKAIFAGSADVGMMKVSFGAPFYAGYNVIAIDKDYKYALVSGSTRRNLWILSRKTYIPDNIKEDYINKARTLGFNTDALIWSEHRD